jgi:bleomycin hydrolase
MKHTVLLLFISIICVSVSLSQDSGDKAFFKEYEKGYYHNVILKDVRHVDKELEKEELDKRFFMDQSGYDLPTKISLYEKVWSQPTISQGNTGTCWCFSTISFYESEIKRIRGKEVKLSEMYTVYWEYVEKARRFVKERGNSLFSQGSEGNAVARMWKKYGTVPLSEYTGLLHGRQFHGHSKMFKEMKSYLEHVESINAWNEEVVLETIQSIMNHHIGAPPEEFAVDGTKYTPKTYLSDYLQINPDDYVEILSYKQEPYWQKVEYKVPDNWWHSEEYYNLPLDDFMEIVHKAIRDGYSMSIGGDVSEAGFLRTTNCAMVPTFDIPSAYINENSRQFRFSNGSTTDDHGMHLIGYYEKDGTDWYLLKDSSSGSRNNDTDAPEFGHYFFHEDYVKLKMMGFTIHMDAVKKYLKKFK